MLASWRSRSEQVEDALVAATLLVMGLVEAAAAPPDVSTRWLQALLAVGYAGSLAFRRRWPVPVLAVVIVIGPVLGRVHLTGGIISYVFAAMLAAYTVGRHRDRPETWWGPGITVGFAWSLLAATGGMLSDYVFVALLYGGSWAVGYALRQRHTRITDLVEQAEQLRREQAAEAARAVAQERTRIARELHDVVAHGLSVITIQTQAVRRRLDPAQQREAADLHAVEAVAREAMAEMRRLLGVLRADADGDVDLAPQPGLAQLPALLADSRAAGVPVQARLVGEPVALTAGADLAAYRVVQEALTNVRKHAHAHSAEVVLTYTPDALEVRVDDDGSPAPSDDAPSGHGLAGMAERVGLYGGTVTAGPRRDGGFRVHARLPYAQVQAP